MEMVFQRQNRDRVFKRIFPQKSDVSYTSTSTIYVYPTSQIFRKFDYKVSNFIKEFGLLYRKYGRFSWVRDMYEVPRYVVHVNFIKISPMKYHLRVNPKIGMF